MTGILLKTFMEANQNGKPVNSDWNAEIPVSFNLGEENSGLSSEVANFGVSFQNFLSGNLSKKFNFEILISSS